MTNLLEQINSPKDLKKLTLEEKETLSQEIRDLIIDVTSKNGGHVASNLGVVELTIALHSIFDTPNDKIVWDVGHQCYVHKILTGISGFPKICESEYDNFNTGHSSTSISIATGMARARDILNENYEVVAVIGDGSLTGGMALEALNDAGSSKTNVKVILNDNEMSISKNVGGIPLYLSKMRTKTGYTRSNRKIKAIVNKIPYIGKPIISFAHYTKQIIKRAVFRNMYFEDIGFTYLGPVDGHDIKKLEDILERSKKINGPVLIHVVTKKGKGYKLAEENPDKFHGISAYDKETGEVKKSKNYSKVFGEKLVKMASEDKRIVAVTAAMRDGTGLKEFAEKFPDRFFDVGIAEQHALGLIAGMARAGLKPVLPIYSSFLQRGYDQIIHDIALSGIPVTVCIDRAGIVGNDGETHQGIFDLSYLGIIPGLTIMAPKNRFEFYDMIQYTLGYDKPVAIRVPRGAASDIFREIRTPIEYGRSEIIRKGERVAIVAAGTGIETAAQTEELLADKGINPTIVNARFVKPFDTVMIEELSRTHDLIVTIEENVMSGGFGMSVLSYVNSNNLKVKVLNIALEDKYIEHGSAQELKEAYGLSPEKICAQIEAEI